MHGPSLCRIWFSAIAAALLACARSATPAPPPLARGDYTAVRAELGRRIRVAMAKHRVQGMSLALVDGDQLVIAEGFGFADAARGIAATPDTPYRVGSISKVFTALEVVRLAEEGAIDLDADIARAVPGFSIRSRFPPARPITPRALLAHHGGLPRDILRGMFLDHPSAGTPIVDDLREESLVAPPQTQFKYSNAGYALLGRAIEVARARSFSDVLRDEVLAPLGMRDSSFAPRPDLSARIAKGYRGGEEIPPYVVRDRDAPASALVSSARDLSRLLQLAFADGRAGEARLIGVESLAAMFRPEFPGLPLDLGREMGLSFFLNELRVAGRPTAAHDGGHPPYMATLALLREEKLGVVVLANSEEASRFIVDIARTALELALEAKLGVAPPAPAPAPARPPTVAAPAAVAAHAGRYVVLGELTELTGDGDHLTVRLGGTELALVPVGEDRFVPEKWILFGLIKSSLWPVEVQFTVLEGRRVALIHGFGDPLACERAEPVPIPATWRARLGRYGSQRPAGERLSILTIELAEDRGVLTATAVMSGVPYGIPGRRVAALRPISEDEAVVVGLGPEEGGTVRAFEVEGRPALQYSGYRFVPIQ